MNEELELHKFFKKEEN
jgi:hypothetical protein